jgi:cobalt-zinc-cadmium resistance protein CzcA
VRVGFHDGVPVTVRDVAVVSEGFLPRQGVVTREKNEDAVEGIVLMRRGENPSVVLEG